MLAKKLIIFCINKKFVDVILTNFSKKTVKKTYLTCLLVYHCDTVKEHSFHHFSCLVISDIISIFFTTSFKFSIHKLL